MRQALLGAAAFVVAWQGGRLVRRWAGALHLLDVPNHRSSHTAPTPRGAGVALALAVWMVFGTSGVNGTAGYPVLLLASALIAAIGLADDIRSLPTIARFAVHSLASSLVVLSIVPAGFAGEGASALPRLAALLAFLWLVGMTNAYNFMDGIDGLAGAQGVVAGLGWFVLGRMIDEPALAVLGLLIAAACAGFLVLNWPPASIFMGDAGSGFLGFTLAGLAVLAARHDVALAACGPLLLWPFLADAAFTLMRRSLRGENILHAHRSHVYQRLVIAGSSHARVTLIYTGLAVIGFSTAAAVAARATGAVIAGLVLMACCAAGVYVHLRRLESTGSDGRLPVPVPKTVANDDAR